MVNNLKPILSFRENVHLGFGSITSKEPPIQFYFNSKEWAHYWGPLVPAIMYPVCALLTIQIQTPMVSTSTWILYITLVYCIPSILHFCIKPQVVKLKAHSFTHYSNWYNIVCPTVPCSTVDVNNICTSDNSRCLVQNKTRETKCVESCYLDNGVCGLDRICFNQVNDDCKPRTSLAECETHVECLGLNGE